MGQLLDAILQEIDRICAEYGDLDGTDVTVEEILLKRQQLDASTMRVIERLEEFSDAWTKEQNSTAHRLLDALSKLSQCSEKIFPQFVRDRLDSMRDGISRKVTQQTDKEDKRLHAVVNVNVNIDRGVLAKANTGKTKRPAPMVRSPVSLIGPDMSPVKSQVPDFGYSSPTRPSLFSQDTHAERTREPSNGNEDDRSANVWYTLASAFSSEPLSTSNSRNLVSERTEAPVPVAPDEQTQRIWMKDDNEDEGGVMPKMTWCTSSVSRPPSNGTRLSSVVASSGRSRKHVEDEVEEERRSSPPHITLIGRPSDNQKRDSVGRAVKSRDLWSLSEDDNQPRKTSEYSMDARSAFRFTLLALASILFAPLLYQLFCCTLTSAIISFSRVGTIVEEILCHFANGICESYGILCTSRCASGLQKDIWESRRG